MRPNFVKELRENGFKHQKGVLFDVLHKFIMENGQYSPIYQDNDEGCFIWVSECKRLYLELSYGQPSIPIYDDKFTALSHPVGLSRKGHLEVEYFDIKRNHIESTKQSWDNFLKTDGWLDYVRKQKEMGLVADPHDIIPDLIKNYVFVPELDENGKAIIISHSNVLSFSNNGEESRTEMIDFPMEVFLPIYVLQQQKYHLGLLNNKEARKLTVNEMER